MNKAWLILALALIFVGAVLFCGVMTTLRWDFSRLSTIRYEENIYTLPETYDNIQIVASEANVELIFSDRVDTAVVCYEEETAKHAVFVENGTLTIKKAQQKKWYDYIGISWDSTRITVELPQKHYKDVSVYTSTGKITLEQLEADNVSLKANTGAVSAARVNCTEEMYVQVTTGKTVLTQVRCGSFASEGSTGDLLAAELVAAGLVSIERSTGDVQLDGCDGGQLQIRVGTGNVTGSLLTEKIFIADTSTGKIQVPACLSGGKCQVTTSTGNITFTIQP